MRNNKNIKKLSLFGVLLIPGAAFSEDFTQIALSKNVLEEMVVTGIRETQSKRETAESVGVFSQQEIEFISPSHPSELLNRVAGVHINNMGGEGHMSSIRQPISTGADYLFLEDGIPTRPTGFFNHNGLYEINIPQSGKVEITKGPGSALYGSGAFGGIINAITLSPPDNIEGNVDFDLGEHGWKRLLVGGGAPLNKHTGVRFGLNATDNDGYREDSEYGRQSLTLRLDSKIGDDISLKNVLTYTNVDQSGVSSLEEEDYKNNPTKNIFHGDIGFREVEALRFSSEWNSKLENSGLLTGTFYYRDNTMNMMPSWMVTYDPNIRKYQFQSYGLMLKHRQNIFDDAAKIIVGVDYDYTPSSYRENSITLLPVIGAGQSRDEYSEYSTGDFNYNFEADQTSFSPYVHTEWKLGKRWFINAGIRYDKFDVDYSDRLATEITASYLRPESQKVHYEEVSPKWSVIYQVTDDLMAYVNYRHAFVSPSVGALFRSGSSEATDKLKQTTADSYEFGLRGNLASYLSYEVAYYEMERNDVIVNYIVDRTRNTTNAGETNHKGIEFTLLGEISQSFSYNIAWTYREQEYVAFQYIYACYNPGCGGYRVETRDFAGNEMGKAPRRMGSLSISYRPAFIRKARVELEAEHVGNYFTDETNNNTYKGHTLYHLRAAYDFSDDVILQLRVMNLTNKKYSTYTQNQVTSSALSYTPGLPLTAYLSLKVKF